MAGKRRQRFFTITLPEAHRPIHAATGEQLAIGAISQRYNRCGMSNERCHRLLGVELPEANHIATTGGKERRLGMKSNGAHHTEWFRKRLAKSAALHVPQA